MDKLNEIKERYKTVGEYNAVHTDINWLIEEIERLYAEQNKEREMIVQWLRTHPPIRYGEPDPMSTREIAYRIMRGDHWPNKVDKT